MKKMNEMKRLLLALMFLASLGQTMAQQRPQFTQYFFNNYLINPAISGIERYIDTKVGYRTQWVGLSGAPVTSFLYAYMPVGKNYIYSNSGSFAGEGNDPNSRSYLQNYTAAEPHHGVGFNVIKDQAGPFNSLNFNVSYAYHMGLSPRLNLALGVNAGLSNDNLDIEKIDADKRNDPAVQNSLGNFTNPDAGVGVWLYGPSFFLGASAQQLLASMSKITYGGKEVPHFYLTGGYKFMVADNISVLPSVMLKYANPSPLTVDVSARVMFRDVFWLGGGYRQGDSFAAIAGFNMGSFINLSYSYDFTTSDLNAVSRGTHEIILGLLLNNRYKVSCPQMLW